MVEIDPILMKPVCGLYLKKWPKILLMDIYPILCLCVPMIYCLVAIVCIANFSFSWQKETVYADLATKLLRLLTCIPDCWKGGNFTELLLLPVLFNDDDDNEGSGGIESILVGFFSVEEEDDDDCDSDGSLGTENGNGGISSIFTRWFVVVVDLGRCFNRMLGIGLDVRDASCVLSMVSLSTALGVIVRPLMRDAFDCRNKGTT